jgi:hypothetical protein
LTPKSTVLLLSPSQRQSGELFKKVTNQYAALGCPVPALTETATQLQLANGSRIISLPGNEQTIRGYSGVKLLVIDEASRVSTKTGGANPRDRSTASTAGTRCRVWLPQP